MPFDSSGTFYRTGGGGGPLYNGTGADIWKGDAAANIKILASSHDIHDQDIAVGLSQAILRDGKGTPTDDIPWGGRKITNLAKPTSLNDAANKDYVDNPDPSEKSRAIHGADLDGRLNFTALTGVNGITWTAADVSWVARMAEASKTQNRLVMNNSVAPNTTGDAVGDVFVIGDTGFVNTTGYLTNNLSFDSASWRTIDPGTGTRLRYLNGVFSVASNDVATITNKYALAPQRDFFTAQNSGGNTTLTLDKADGAIKTADIAGSAGGVSRWLMRLGSPDAESGVDRGGSNFQLYSYNNAGTVPALEIFINRASHLMTTGGAITSAGLISSGGNFTAAGGSYMSTSTGTVLSNDGAGGGIVYLRPNGNASATGQVYVTVAGDLNIPEGHVFVSGGSGVGTSGITLNESGFGDFARAGTAAGLGFCRFINNNGVIGSITSASATSVAYVTTSDERLKDVIGDYAADAAIAIIRADPVKAFTWKASGERAVGWLAQRSYAIDKNLAVPPEMHADGKQTDETDRWGIDYGSRTPYLWAALAAALDKIDLLESRLAALEAAA